MNFAFNYLFQLLISNFHLIILLLFFNNFLILKNFQEFMIKVYIIGEPFTNKLFTLALNKDS